MTDRKLEVISDYEPAGDQPKAIEQLTAGLKEGKRHQTLLGVTGSGKSVVADTQVLIREGGSIRTVSIGHYIDEQLERSKNVVRVVGDTEVLDIKTNRLKTWSFSPQTGQASWKPIVQMTRHIAPRTLRTLRTACGRAVTATNDHSFYRLHKGTLLLSRASEVEIGDCVPLPRALPGSGTPLTEIDVLDTLISTDRAYFVDLSQQLNVRDTVLVSLPYHKRYRIEHFDDRVPLADCVATLSRSSLLELTVGTRSRVMSVSLRQPVTDEFLRFLGYYIAEGHATRNYIMLSSADEEIISDIRNEALIRGMSFAHRQGTYDYQLNSGAWADIFRSWVGAHAVSKRLPPFWQQLSNAQLAQLLSAYFSADGGVDSGSVSATTVSKTLASDIMLALLRFGINARLRRKLVKVPHTTRRTEVWVMNIYGRDQLRNFAEFIGFTLARKRDALLNIIPPTANTNIDLIPLPVNALLQARTACKLLQRDIAASCDVERSYISMLECGTRSPSRTVAQSLLHFFEAYANIPEAAALVSSLASALPLFWSPVVSTEEVPREQFVYDFAVDENETFLANGIFVHNTFTAANVIANYGKPTLVIAHNKTLAAQLAAEYRSFFPNSAVHYFVSYYDYYQPEAYVPVTDTYIEKEAQINEDIERLRHASTQALLSRKDVIIVASVSCIYGLGSPEEYEKVNIKLEKGTAAPRAELIRRLISLYFDRTNADLSPGTFRAMGNMVEIMPANEYTVYRVELEKDTIVRITEIDPVTRVEEREHDALFLFPAKHYVTPEEERDIALKDIEAELEAQLKKFNDSGRLLEADRLKRRTRQDIALIREFGYCSGIENYSRHFDRRTPGTPPHTLLSYFPHTADGTPDFLTIIDESHVTVPQIGAMYAGDRARKNMLIEHGFRLPSALDNRPLMFEEFEQAVGPTIYTSATPGVYELERSGTPVEQIIRPTGLIDPVIEVRKVVGSGNYPGQVHDFIREAEETTKRGARSLVTVLTKKMAEDLTEFLLKKDIKAQYVHSDVKTMDRIEILTNFRKGAFDVLVGVNLLREGLDLPEVELVGILDADKEGFLRSETSLVQTIGRAARNIAGRVLLYADSMTGSLERAISETNRRREIQVAYNTEHGITPQSVTKKITDIMGDISRTRAKVVSHLAELDMKAAGGDVKKVIAEKRTQMKTAATELDFETAALLRDEIAALERTHKL